jgi:hypothetical protein
MFFRCVFFVPFVVSFVNRSTIQSKGSPSRQEGVSPSSLSQVGSGSGALILSRSCFHHPPRQTQRAHLTHCAFLMISHRALAYHVGATFLGATLKLLYMLYIAYSPFVLHRVQPKPCFPLAFIKCVRIFLVNQSITYPNALPEFPILKCCSQPFSAECFLIGCLMLSLSCRISQVLF